MLIQATPTTWINPDSVDVVTLNPDNVTYRVVVGTTTFPSVPAAIVQPLMLGFFQPPANVVPIPEKPPPRDVQP